MDFISQFSDLDAIDTTYSVNSSTYEFEDVAFDFGFPVVISYQTDGLEISVKSNIAAEMYMIFLDEAEDKNNLKHTDIQKLSQGLTESLSSSIASINLISTKYQILNENNFYTSSLRFEGLEPSHSYVCYITLSSLEQGTRFDDPMEALYMTTDTVENYILLGRNWAGLSAGALAIWVHLAAVLLMK